VTRQDRGRAAAHPPQGTARAAGRVRNRRRAAGHLTDLADPRGALGWHRDYAGILPGGWQDYLTLETAATGIAAYDAQRVRGLLQPPAYAYAYARALAKTDPSLADDRARGRAAQAVIARQRAILSELRPEVHLVIGRAALH
jgi:Domain of unknown function (DUF5753)